MSSSIRELRERFLSLFRKRKLDDDLNEEFAAHIEMATEDNIRAGMNPQEARRRAMIRFGGVEAAGELHREARGLPLIESLSKDIRCALRTLRRDAGFTAGVTLLLALGIGANVAVFSIVNGILFRPLPYPDPDRLVVAQEMIPELDNGPRAARLLWPQGNPIGRHFRRSDPQGNSYEVVGLVPDVHTEDLAAEPEANVYLPLTATGGVIYLTNSIAVRVQGHPSTAATILRNAVASLDRQLPISKVQMMQQIESAVLGERRLQLSLIGAFAVASLLVAAVGTYSVLAYAIARRTPELALRMALGAQRANVMAMVLRSGIRPVLLGVCLGVAGALALGRLLSSLLFSVTPTDARTFAIVIALTLAAAILACWIPARRASRTSLLDALRYE